MTFEAAQIQVEVVVCERCKLPLGEVVQVGELQLLQSGGILHRAAHGMCRRCGREFHWTVSDQLLARLVQRVLGRRE